MFRYLIIFCFFILTYADYDNITIHQLLKKAALLNNINIVIPDDLNTSKTYTISINNFIKAKDLLQVSKVLLQKQGYTLNKLNKKFYIVDRIKDKRYKYIYKVKKSNTDYLLSKIKYLYPNTLYKLDNKYLLIKYTKTSLLKEVLSNLKRLDTTIDSYYISLNIYNTDTKALHELGINLNNNNDPETGLIIKPHLKFIPALIKLLSDNKKSKLIASPKLFLSPDLNTTAEFKEVTTIPIVVKKTQIIQGTNPIVNNIDETIYKDVGLMLKLRYINATEDKKVKFHLFLTDSNIINYTNTGITSSERTIDAIIQAKLNQTIFIAGLSKQKTTKRIVGFPVLKDLPIIGALFKRTEKTNENRTLVITLTIEKVAQ